MADAKKPGGGFQDVPRTDPGVRPHSREDFLSLFKRGQEFTEELMQENERLRFQVAGLQEELSQVRRQMDQDTVVRDLLTQIKALESDRQRLLDHYRNVEEQNRDYNTRYLEIEEAHNNLANLYVASYQLHSTLRFPDVMQIISEILLNLIGAEEFGIYLLDEQAGAMDVLVAEGRALESFPRVKLGEGPIGRSVKDNVQRIRQDVTHGTPEEPVAVIPLTVGERRVGGIVLLKLLVQKQELAPLDLEIFSLLGAHAATAILASVQQSAAPVLATRTLYDSLWQAPAVRPEEA